MRKDIDQMSVSEFSRFRTRRNNNRKSRIKKGFLDKDASAEGVSRVAVTATKIMLIMDRVPKYVGGDATKALRECRVCGETKDLWDAAFDVQGFGFKKVCRACESQRLKDYRKVRKS